MPTLSNAQIYAAAKAAGFTPAEAVIATAIARAESGGNPAATHHNTNGTTDYGLWQINSVHTGLFTGSGSWEDPVNNARMAHAVYSSQGWHAWTTYNSGAYTQYETAAPVSNATNVSLGGDLGAAGSGAVKGLTQLGQNLTHLNPLGLNPFGNGTLGAIGNAASGLKAVFTVEFWERFGWGLLGFVMVLIGFTFMVESNKTARDLTGAAVMA